MFSVFPEDELGKITSTPLLVLLVKVKPVCAASETVLLRNRSRLAPSEVDAATTSGGSEQAGGKPMSISSTSCPCTGTFKESSRALLLNPSINRECGDTAAVDCNDGGVTRDDDEYSHPDGSFPNTWV